MSTMKTLIIRPADVSLNPLGAGSNVADATVSVVYDRDVWANGQPVPRVPLVSTSIPTAGLRVPVLASDDPSITEGAGFVIKVVVETAPRIGQHNDMGARLARTIQVVAADPDEIPLGSKSNLTVVPDPAQYADVGGISGALASITAQVTTVEERVRTNPDLPAAWGLFDPNGRGFGVWMPDGSLDTIPLKAITQQLEGSFASVAVRAESLAAWGIYDTTGRGFGVWMPDGSLDTIPLKAITQQLGMSRATSGANILAVGTSLTANVDSSSGKPYASSWPIVLGGLIGRDAVNRGWSGRNSRAISVMFGATPWQTTAAITLPSTAGGTVNVPTDVEVDYPARPASIAGVLGTIKRGTTATTGVFTRTNAGDAWPIPAGTTVWCQPVEDYSDRILIIECSRNDDPADVTGIIDRTRRIITTLTAGVTNPRVLVHGQPLSTRDTPESRVARGIVNDALRAEFRAQYVDSWAYLRSDACATSLGITWTDQDKADIIAGLTPKQIRLDDLHPTNLGHQALAYFFRDEITRRGWTA